MVSVHPRGCSHNPPAIRVVSPLHHEHTAKPQQGRSTATQTVEMPCCVLADCCLPAAPAAAAQAGAFAVSTAYEDSTAIRTHRYGSMFFVRVLKGRLPHVARWRQRRADASVCVRLLGRDSQCVNAERLFRGKEMAAGLGFEPSSQGPR